MKSWTMRVLGCAALTMATTGVSAGAAEVSVKVFQFRPGPLEVKSGARVVWTNEDDIEHTITAGTPERRDGRFDLALDGKGATAGWEFTTPGVYPYFCSRHQGMRGEIRVGAK